MTLAVWIFAAVQLLTPQNKPAEKRVLFMPVLCPSRFQLIGGEPFVVQKMAFIALAGALGTLTRYSFAEIVHRLGGASFPWGTVFVNLTGCFLAGLLWALFEHRWPVTGETRTIVLFGFMGAFTTFSALILETGELLRAAEWVHAAGNIVMQNGLGFAALFAGMALGRLA